MEKPIKMDDLGVPLFLETPMWTHLSKRNEPSFEHQQQNPYYALMPFHEIHEILFGSGSGILTVGSLEPPPKKIG